MPTTQDSPEEAPVYRMNLLEAIKALKEARVIHEGLGLAEAVDVLMGEFDRMHEALEFYANRHNYDDEGAACKRDDSGLLDAPDKGEAARYALRKMDLSGRPLTKAQARAVAEGMQG